MRKGIFADPHYLFLMQKANANVNLFWLKLLTFFLYSVIIPPELREEAMSNGYYQMDKQIQQ